ANQNLSVGLHGDGVHWSIGARIEADIDRPIGVESRDEVARRAAGPAATKHREGAADDDLAVRLNGHGSDIAVRAGIETAVERSIGVQASDAIAHGRAGAATSQHRERSADQDLSVRLNSDDVDRAV